MTRVQSLLKKYTLSFHLLCEFYDPYNIYIVVLTLNIIFCSRNGPVGSAVCAYSFDKNDFDLVKAFRGRYINEESAFTWGFSNERGDINVSRVNRPIGANSIGQPLIVLRNSQLEIFISILFL